MSDATRRSWLGLIFDFRDFFFLALWWAVAATLTALVGFLIYTVIEYEAAQRATIEAMDRQIKAHNINERKLEEVRVATESGNLGEIRKAVADAIDTSRDLGNAPAATAPADSNGVSAAEVRQLIETPDIRPLEQVRFPQKVYIQFAGSLTRAQITALNSALRQAGWRMQSTSGERTPAAAGMAQVRFAGENGPAAQKLADALNQSGLPIRPVTAQHHAEIGDNLEVWISN